MPRLTGRIISWLPDKKCGKIQYFMDKFFYEEDDISKIYDRNAAKVEDFEFDNASIEFNEPIKIGRAVSFLDVSTSNGHKAESVKKLVIQYRLSKESAQLVNMEDGGENYALMINRFSRRAKSKSEIIIKPELYYYCLDGPKNDNVKPLSLIYVSDIIKNVMIKNESIMHSSKCKFRINFKVFDKLAIGIGCQSPYSSVALITLHHVYGIPYIPGSALKGLLRHYFEMEVLKNSKNKMNNNTFLDLFGADENEEGGARRGKLFFLDAFPTETPEITFDVLTPHNSDYFGKNGIPTDYANPVPTFFPAIKPVNFEIYVGAFSEVDENTMNTVGTVLKEALENYGIGAKTSVGYGLGHAELIEWNNQE